jgi:hypothetical protein
MKRILTIALLTIAGFLTAGSALAADHAVKADIPFDFIVGSNVLPAGTYTIASPGWRSSGAIEIQSEGSNYATLTTVFADNKATKGSELVFHRYGNQYFLAEVLCPAAAMTVQLPVSKQEKLARTTVVAGLQPTGEVLVAAK